MSSRHVDVIILGAGAAGLMCAATAGYRGRSVLVVDQASQPGRKILMSGGGRCNFTHLHSTPAHFLSENPHFCISALKRYTPQHFLELVERHDIPWEEKAPGQLFCQHSSRDILSLLLTECEWAGASLQLNTRVERVDEHRGGFCLETSSGQLFCERLVVATGGLSIPSMGGDGFGYRLAQQFGLSVLPTRPGLVPFTLPASMKSELAPLAGISCPVTVSCGQTQFTEPILVTHRGLSGPGILQISSFWTPGQTLHIDLLPGTDAERCLLDWRQQRPQATLAQCLAQPLPKRFAQAFSALQGWEGPLQHCSNQQLGQVAALLNDWQLLPAGTEGYRTAEVTLGGIDTRQLSSRTMACLDLPQLSFIGEVVDVTGHLGGHNFQWAWASAVAAGNAL